MCFFVKHKTAYEMRISDWSSDVCSSDLTALTDEGTPDHTPDWISASAPAPVQPSLFDTAAPPAQPWGDDGDPGPVEPPIDDADIDPGLQKRPSDLDLPHWLKGRYGTDVGREVHGVLQTARKSQRRNYSH